MKRKIFISINLSNRDKKRLVRATEKWQDLPVKWTKEANLHITLEFMGFVLDNVVLDICDAVREAASEVEMFDLEFEKIELGSTKVDPRMIWLSGAASDELKNLHEKIQKALDIFTTSKKAFRPHITLGKIRQHKWQELENVPAVERDFPMTIAVESVDVMASEFEGGGMEYAIIESCPLS
ncbi:MAG: RNA 2',3'-cyclic phosphodiesterase [Parcubacteria group bacterium]|jgi:2'-5' RNA ligase